MTWHVFPFGSINRDPTLSWMALLPYSMSEEGRFLQNTWMAIGAQSDVLGCDSREILI